MSRATTASVSRRGADRPGSSGRCSRRQPACPSACRCRERSPAPLPSPAGCLRDLQRFFRYDDPEARPAFFAVSKYNFARSDLVPLIVTYPEDYEVVYNARECGWNDAHVWGGGCCRVVVQGTGLFCDQLLSNAAGGSNAVHMGGRRAGLPPAVACRAVPLRGCRASAISGSPSNNPCATVTVAFLPGRSLRAPPFPPCPASFSRCFIQLVAPMHCSLHHPPSSRSQGGHLPHDALLRPLGHHQPRAAGGAHAGEWGAVQLCCCWCAGHGVTVWEQASRQHVQVRTQVGCDAHTCAFCAAPWALDLCRHESSSCWPCCAGGAGGIPGPGRPGSGGGHAC